MAQKWSMRYILINEIHFKSVVLKFIFHIFVNLQKMRCPWTIRNMLYNVATHSLCVWGSFLFQANRFYSLNSSMINHRPKACTSRSKISLIYPFVLSSTRILWLTTVALTTSTNFPWHHSLQGFVRNANSDMKTTKALSSYFLSVGKATFFSLWWFRYRTEKYLLGWENGVYKKVGAIFLFLQSVKTQILEKCHRQESGWNLNTFRGYLYCSGSPEFLGQVATNIQSFRPIMTSSTIVGFSNPPYTPSQEIG